MKKFKTALFWIFTLLVVTFLLSITILFKSITPLYEVDEINKKVYLLGRKYKFDFNTEIRPKITHFLDKENYRTFLDGDLSVKNIEKLEIRAINSEMTIESYGKKFIYKCRSTKQEQQVAIIKDKELIFDVKGESLCQIVLPPEKETEINIKGGLLRVHSINQNINLYFNDGMVIWNIPRQRVDLELDLENSQIYGIREQQKPKKPKYLAKLHIKNSILSLR